MRQVITLLNQANQLVSFNVNRFDGELSSVEMRVKFLDKKKLIVDIRVDDEVHALSVLVNNGMPLLHDRNIKGTLYFLDNNGDNNPTWEEFNKRYFLVYDEDYVDEMGN